MKSKLSFSLVLFLLLFSGLLLAQKYKIDYRMTVKSNLADPTFSKNDMILLIDHSKSKFLHRSHYEGDSIAASTALTNGLLPPRALNFKQMIKKNHETKTYSEYLYLLGSFYETKSPLPALDWKISSETKTRGEYKVQKALLSHSGREWEAWFATEISIPEGPSVFYGLPGLILSMKDASGDYQFDFMGIRKEDDIDVDYQWSEPIEISKAQKAKLLLDYYKNPVRDTALPQDGAAPSLSSMKERKERIQKNLRENNIPVELEDRVPYP